MLEQEILVGRKRQEFEEKSSEMVSQGQGYLCWPAV